MNASYRLNTSETVDAAVLADDGERIHAYNLSIREGKLNLALLLHIDGVIFLVIFAGFIALMIKSALKASKEGNALASEEIEAAEGIQILPMWKSLLYIVGGGAAIMIGGDVVVNSASNIAAKFVFKIIG